MNIFRIFGKTISGCGKTPERKGFEMNKKIKTALVFCTTATVLVLASCKGRVGEDVIDGDEYTENYNDGRTYDEEIYNGGMNYDGGMDDGQGMYDTPAEMLDMSPDSANITK